jgi:hypothetical protein
MENELRLAAQLRHSVLHSRLHAEVQTCQCET